MLCRSMTLFIRAVRSLMIERCIQPGDLRTDIVNFSFGNINMLYFHGISMLRDEHRSDGV